MQLPEGLCSGISARDKNLHATANRKSLRHSATEEGLYEYTCIRAGVQTYLHRYVFQ